MAHRGNSWTNNYSNRSNHHFNSNRPFSNYQPNLYFGLTSPQPQPYYHHHHHHPNRPSNSYVYYSSPVVEKPNNQTCCQDNSKGNKK
ncbi:component of gems protein 1-like [Rhinatrema bivittatum]|uniref:component of gems protein 1-like n=1 Tax=Rhinatrema bivittatum TaxID=194408 RepID=UPI00112AA8BF|nr:component of gems protein 1-like [Rhinatrema bivittatum]